MVRLRTVGIALLFLLCAGLLFRVINLAGEQPRNTTPVPVTTGMAM